MQINVVSLGNKTTQTSKNGNTYVAVELTYKDTEGRTKNKKLMSFQRDIYNVLSSAMPGDTYEVKTEKKGQFWEWMGAEKVTGAAAVAAAAPVRAGGGGYGGKNDVQIARSVALKAAVDWVKDNTTDVDNILQIANRFEDYVLNGLRDDNMEKAIGENTLDNFKDDPLD